MVERTSSAMVWFAAAHDFMVRQVSRILPESLKGVTSSPFAHMVLALPGKSFRRLGGFTKSMCMRVCVCVSVY